MATSKKPDTFEGGMIPVADNYPIQVSNPESNPEQVSIPVPPPVQLPSVENLDAVQAIIQQAMAARDAEVSALRQELQAIKVNTSAQTANDAQGAGGYPWMFWRKPQTWPDTQSRGWLSIGPGGPTPAGNRDTGSYNLYLRKGMTPVTKYGYINPPVDPEARKIFMPLLRKGGAIEFPASQVIAFKWHIDPPIEGLTFPQYELVKGTVINFVCEACGHTLYFMPTEKAVAGENYRAHLMVTHKYPFREAAEAIRLSGFVARPFAQDISGAPARDS